MATSPICWPGGKRALVRRLLPLIPAHKNYIEVFAGSAKLLFAKEPSQLEVINDLNGDLITFFRVAKHRPAELAERLEHECIHAARFRELLARPRPGDELDQALRFVYLTWWSFGGKGESFARCSATNPKRRRPLDTVRTLLDQCATRLARVLIEQQDFAEILARYDSRETFFYLDPPYVEYSPNGRYEPLTRERRAEMFGHLARLKAQWLMSFEDHAEARAAARRYGFSMRRVGVVYTIRGKSERKESPELLLSNFPLAA
jgi:DNA adenine methylase